MSKRWSDLYSLECFSCGRVATSTIIGLKNSKRVMISILQNSPTFSLSFFTITGISANLILGKKGE